MPRFQILDDDAPEFEQIKISVVAVWSQEFEDVMRNLHPTWGMGFVECSECSVKCIRRTDGVHDMSKHKMICDGCYKETWMGKPHNVIARKSIIDEIKRKMS